MLNTRMQPSLPITVVVPRPSDDADKRDDNAATGKHGASPSSDSGSASARKKRRMTTLEGSSNSSNSSVTSPSGVSSPHPTRRLSFHDSARESARRRWRLLQKHVCITQWLSKDLMRRQMKRFALAQESLVDVLMTSRDDYMEVFVKIREQFLSLLDAENCYLSFEANRTILEFDGRSISPSTRARRGLLRQAMTSGEPVHLFHPTTSNLHTLEGIPASIDVRSYICLPLVDGDGAVQAVAEIFNSRQDAKTIDSWLKATCNGSLHVLRNFVGNLIRAFAKCTNIGDLVTSSIAGGGNGALSASRRESVTAPGSEVSEYPLESLMDFVRHTVGVSHCSVFAYDKDADLLWSRLSDCPSCPATVKCGEGIIGKAALDEQPVLYSGRAPCEDLDEAEGIFEELFGNMNLPRESIRDVLCIPTMNANQKLNGVVVLLNKTDQSVFSEADIAMSVNLCRHIGNALHSSELHEAILKAQGKAQTLLDLSAVLFRELETNALLLAIMDAIKKPMNASKCCMFLMDEEKHELVAPVGSDISNDTTHSVVRVPATAGIVGAAAQAGEIINVRDAYKDHRFDASVDRQTGFVTRSILAVPIKDADGEVLGVLEMVNKLSKQYFDKDDEELARGIAYYLAIALKNARLFESACSAMRRSDALLAMMQVISSSNDNVGDVFRALVDTACQILNVEHGALFFVDSLSKTLFCRVGGNWKGYTIPLGKFIPGLVAERGEMMSLTNARRHPEFDVEYDDLTGVVTKSLLCVPIRASSGASKGDRGNVIAVFYAANKLTGTGTKSAFCEDDIKIMNAICAELSSIIERRSWELVFMMESSHDSSSDTTEVTSSFLSQYTTTHSVSRRRSSSLRSRSDTPVFDEPAPGIGAPAPTTGIGGGLLSKVFAGGGGTGGPRPAIDVSAIRNWNLSPWEHSAPQLVDFVLGMFEYFDLLVRFQVPRQTMRRFIVSVKGQYQDIPYHNFYHAFTTLHVSFLIVSSQSCAEAAVAAACRPAHLASLRRTTREGQPPPINLLEIRDIMSIFVAAFCHDMNHNGRTNDFHIRYRTSIAMLYNDQSVLENMHAAACFETMRRPGHDILEHVSASEYRQMRKSIIRAILATDMHNHAGIVTHLHEKLKVGVFNPEDDGHKELLINAIVHSADISGPALTEKIHVRWSLQLLEEFNLQYAEEVALGMTPTPYMNAQPESPELGKLNLAFIDSCVFPLWSIMDTFLEGLETCLENIQSNRAVWITMINDASPPTTTATTAAAQ